LPYLGFEPMRIERFGGLNTLIDATNLPNYASPDCSDVDFLPGLVKTRPGLTSVFAALGGNPTVNYLKTYITPTVTDSIRTLVLDSLGNLRKEDATLTPGTLSLISSLISPNAYASSVSLFGREYMAFGDGQFGLDVPRQYDDTNLDRISCDGPGLSPSAADEAYAIATTGETQPATVAIVASPTERHKLAAWSQLPRQERMAWWLARTW